MEQGTHNITITFSQEQFSEDYLDSPANTKEAIVSVLNMWVQFDHTSDHSVITTHFYWGCFGIFALGCLLNMPFWAFLLSPVNVKQGCVKISDNKVFGQLTSTIDILVIQLHSLTLLVFVLKNFIVLQVINQEQFSFISAMHTYYGTLTKAKSSFAIFNLRPFFFCKTITSKHSNKLPTNTKYRCYYWKGLNN